MWLDALLARLVSTPRPEKLLKSSNTARVYFEESFRALDEGTGSRSIYEMRQQEDCVYRPSLHWSV